jgi:hypothetical protein
MYDRPKAETALSICPLCPTIPMDLSKILEHIAQHMEGLALFALPKEVPDDGDGSKSKHTYKAECLGSDLSLSASLEVSAFSI